MSKKDLFASSSDDDNSDTAEDNELARQMATAAMRVQRRDPHAYTPFTGNQKKKFSSVSTTHTTRNNEEKEEDGDSSDSSSSSDNDSPWNNKEGVDGSEARGVRDAKKQKKKNGEKDATEDGGIRINKQYASKYEEVKRRKELQQLSQKYGNRLRVDDSEEDDEEDEEDDEAVLLTEEKELAFAKAFLAIRRSGVKEKKKEEKEEKKTSLSADGDVEKSDDLLAPGTAFFPPSEDQVRENTEVFMRSVAMKREKRKTFTLADEYRRGVLTGHETGNKNADKHENEEGEKFPQGNRRIQPQTAKERQLRDSFLKNVEESADAFSVQPVAVEQGKEEEEDGQTSSQVKRLLEGAFSIRGTDTADREENEEDPDEAFLRDFFVQELWKPNKKRKQTASKRKNTNNDHEEEEIEEEEEDEGNNYAALAELAQAEEDERFYAEAEAWERAYQDRVYRHQEEDADHVQTFPRAIGENAAGILRKSVKSSRKESRLRRLEKMKEIREQQVAELRRLKTLKRQEIESQRALIASVAGIVKSQESGLGTKKGKNKKTHEEEEEEAMARLRALWNEKDLDEDFDPKKFDKKMAQIFDDAYYDEDNVDEEEMAFFDEEEDAEKQEEEEKDVEEEPEWYRTKSLEEAVAMTATNTSNKKHKMDNNMHSNVDDAFALLYPSSVMEAAETEVLAAGSREHIEQMIQAEKGEWDKDNRRAGGKKKEEVLKGLKAELEQKEEEYWKLHHDSTLDRGAIKTRFRYRQVTPEDFTLSVEEILSRDDRQLNMLVPMSCYAAYLQEEANRRDRMKVERRRQRGFREIDPSRSSRRYGDVAKTVLVDANMTEEEGDRWATEIRSGLRRLRESAAAVDSDDDVAEGGDGSGSGHEKQPRTSQKHEERHQQSKKTPVSKKPRFENERKGRGRGVGNGNGRGRGMPHISRGGGRGRGGWRNEGKTKQ